MIRISISPLLTNRVFLFSLLFIGFSFYITASSNPPKNRKINIVEDVDLSRYVGIWYEIARFPHRFEKNLVGVTATYNLKENNHIEVINQGYKFTLDGELKRAVGKAKVPDANKTGHLRVSFFWIFYADYYILELDKENYQYALIGSSSDKYLWILSRTPKMDEAVYKMLVDRARDLGYDVKRLELVPQKE